MSAWSAKLAVSAGFVALTVGSHPVADSVGKPDGEGMSFDDLTTRVSQITAAVDVPVSVDIESGYGEAPSRLISGLLAAGAVGLNIEDTVHKDGGRIRDAQEHADLVGELRRAADASGVHVVINARTGSVVMNQAVTLQPCAVAHGNLAVTISSTPQVSARPNTAPVSRLIRLRRTSGPCRTGVCPCTTTAPFSAMKVSHSGNICCRVASWRPDAGARVTPCERAASRSGQNASGTCPSPSRSVPSMSNAINRGVRIAPTIPV